MPYYEAQGRSVDYLVRCRGNRCGRLVSMEHIRETGACPACGGRRWEEVRSLGLFEYLRVRCGLIDFPHRQAFLKEFRFFEHLRRLRAMR